LNRVPIQRLVIAVVFAQLVACSSQVTPVLGCIASQGLTPICALQNPEDLVATPSDRWLLVSQMGAMDGALAGSIAAYEPSSGRIETLFPVGEFDDVRDWGDPDCPPPADRAFAPHGIDLQVRPDGALELLVVNHGDREAVEFFAVEENDAGLALYWRGCALAPEHAFFNDVTGRRAGGFWVTDMMPKNHRLWTIVKALLFGSNTGRVYGWSAAGGFVAVAGSEMPFPNGIAKAPDDDVLYVASFLGDEVRKIDIARGTVIGNARMLRPDNLTWAPDGKLLVASHTDALTELLACRDLAEGACGSAFEIVQLDPESMSSLVLLAHRGAPLGGVSVAVQVGDELYLGSVAGDRIARWRFHPD
jgi:SMP-30/Gluconolactonase/LRE-like region